MGWRRTRVEKDTRTVVVLVGQEPIDRCTARDNGFPEGHRSALPWIE